MTDAERDIQRQTAAAVLLLLAAVPDRSVDGVLQDAGDGLRVALDAVDQRASFSS